MVAENQTFNQHEYCLMASLNKETNSFDIKLGICTDASGGEFDVVEMDWGTKIGEYILPVCMLNAFRFDCIWLRMRS